MFVKPVGVKRYFLYFLKLEHGYFYTGITNNLARRISQHKTGHGSVVTRAHKPVELVAAWDIGDLEYSDAERIEDEFAVYFMRLYGPKVRGGKWTRNKENVRKVLKNKPVYCPCNEFEMIAHDQAIKCGATKPRKKKKPMKKNKMKFKNRQEQVEWICKGKLHGAKA